MWCKARVTNTRKQFYLVKPSSKVSLRINRHLHLHTHTYIDIRTHIRHSASRWLVARFIAILCSDSFLTPVRRSVSHLFYNTKEMHYASYERKREGRERERDERDPCGDGQAKWGVFRVVAVVARSRKMQIYIVRE